jgi:hypothetical protein
LYQDEIASKIKVQINQNLNAQVNWEDASLSLLTHFPHITLDLEEIQIIGKNEFQKDTLANIKEINVEIPVFSYLLNQKITL